MATYDTTSKHGSRALTGANVGSDIDAGFTALRDDIDNKMATYSEGTFASRPTSTGGSPGKTGRVYRATDTGRYYIDNGTGWDELDRVLRATATWDPPSIPAGSFTTTTIAVTGAPAGAPVLAGFPLTSGVPTVPLNLGISASVFETGSVIVILTNNTASAIDPPSGTLDVRVRL